MITKEQIQKRITIESYEHAQEEGDNGNAVISFEQGAKFLLEPLMKAVEALEKIERANSCQDELVNETLAEIQKYFEEGKK